jgi:hemerythrin
MQQKTRLSVISCGHAGMDKIHEELFASLAYLAACDDAGFRYAFAAFVRQIERAFLLEETWMDLVDFEGTLPHQEQHARVLGALHHVNALVMRGEVDVGRDTVQRLLPQWLSFHAETMDTALAISMQTAEIQDIREPSYSHLNHHAPAAIH